MSSGLAGSGFVAHYGSTKYGYSRISTEVDSAIAPPAAKAVREVNAAEVARAFSKGR